MPYYSEEILEEVRSRNDIVDVIGNYVHLQRRGGSYFGLCPFHNEKTPSFCVTPSKQMFHCFGCGKGGNVFSFLMEYENMTFPEAVKSLADQSGVALPEQEPSAEERQKEDRKMRLREVNKEAAKYFYALLRSPRGERAYAYFTERKLTKETMHQFALGYADQYSDDLYRYLRQKGYPDDLLRDSGLVTMEARGTWDKFWNRAMFPITDERNRVIAFGGRVMGEGEPKYLNSPETLIFNKSKTLYGLQLARRTRRPQMILCEGYMDVIALHQAGFDNAVASLGTSLTEEHANILKRYTKDVCLSYDSDGAGVKAALRAIPILKDAGMTVRVVNMRPYKDPDEFIKALGAEAYQERLDAAENSFLYEVRMAESNYDMADPAGRTAFFREVADKLQVFEEELERESYIDAISRQYHVDSKELRQMVNRRAMARGGIQPRPQPKNGMAERKPKVSALEQSERLLLTWLSDDVRLFDVLGDVLEPEDFSEGLNREVARLLFAQYEENGEIQPAAIIDRFPPEDSDRLAALFTAVLPGIEEENQKRKSLEQSVKNIKLASLDRNMDLVNLKAYMEGRKKIENLKLF